MTTDDDAGYYFSYVDPWGRPLGYCDSCGTEGVVGDACCEDGEIVPYVENTSGE